MSSQTARSAPARAERIHGGPVGASDHDVHARLCRAKPPGVLDDTCPAGLADLGTPEREVLQLLLIGSTDRAIAEALVVSPDQVSWCVRKLIKRVGHRTTRAGLVALALRHGLVEHPCPQHPGHLPDEGMALLWSMACGQTFKTFAKGIGTWEAERIRTHLRIRLCGAPNPERSVTAPLTPGHTVYLAWPALAEEAGWGSA